MLEGIGALYGRVLRLVSPARYREHAIRETGARYDMTREPSEDYYARMYLHFIGQDLRDRFGAGKLAILDYGCGQGRLSIPLAQEGHRVTGVDISPEAIGRADENAREAGVTVSWHAGGMESLPGAFTGESFDVILCTEVLYMAEDPVPLLTGLLGYLRPGGILLLSLRTRYYYLLKAVRERDWPVARMVAGGTSGSLGGIGFNWHTEESAAALLAAAGARPVRCRGIGISSGIPGDPLAAICTPSDLPPADQQALGEIELLLAGEYAGNGRYLYIAAEKATRPGA
jgi:2-polyprenyl-3-methyl-5-hydroxy-6-metoxy-1,4-benzoquinol methylase